MTFANLKPDPVAPDLMRLGEIVLAVATRLRAPGVTRHWDSAQSAWPEAMELARSIEEGEGWLLFVANRGQAWERLFLYLDAPQVFLRSSHMHVETFPQPPLFWWSMTMRAVVESAKITRYKRLGKDTPAYSDAILNAMRTQQFARWGQL